MYKRNNYGRDLFKVRSCTEIMADDIKIYTVYQSDD